MNNVIVLIAGTVEQVQQSLRGLRSLHDAGDLGQAFAVVERTEDGRVIVLDQVEDVHIRATAAGGVVGGIVGLLSGPLGLLVDGATGAVVGSLVDIADAESSDGVLRNLTSAVPPGRCATTAAVSESSQNPVDAMARRLGVAVFRKTRTEIELQIAEAETALNDARRQDEASKPSIGDRLRDQGSVATVMGPPLCESRAMRFRPATYPIGGRCRAGQARPRWAMKRSPAPEAACRSQTSGLPHYADASAQVNRWIEANGPRRNNSRVEV